MPIPYHQKAPSFSWGIIVTLAAFSLLILVIIMYYSWQSQREQLQTHLSTLSDIVKSDISYHDGQWDITKYLNDTQIPNDIPLYVITSEGYVVDRRNILINFLDTSDLRFSSSFQTPQTITTPVGETWYMYSKPLIRNRISYGTILLAYHQPEFSSINEIELQLKDLGRMIDSRINVSGDNLLDLSGFDPKTISGKISYQIVDTRNKVAATSGPIPSYIDRSYLSSFDSDQFINIKNGSSIYTAHIAPIVDNNRQIGVVVTAQDTIGIGTDVGNKVLLAYGLTLMSVTLLLSLMPRLLPGHLGTLALLSFDKKSSRLFYQDKELPIPLDSNQYYVLVALFSKPGKRWETDELTDIIFGQTSLSEMKSYWRKIYDAVRSINQKTQNTFGQKIIETEAKTFRLRSHLVYSN